MREQANDQCKVHDHEINNKTKVKRPSRTTVAYIKTKLQHKVPALVLSSFTVFTPPFMVIIRLKLYMHGQRLAYMTLLIYDN